MLALPYADLEEALILAAAVARCKGVLRCALLAPASLQGSLQHLAPASFSARSMAVELISLDEGSATATKPAAWRAFLQRAAVSLAALAPAHWFIHGLVAR